MNNLFQNNPDIEMEVQLVLETNIQDKDNYQVNEKDTDNELEFHVDIEKENFKDIDIENKPLH